MKIYVKVAFCTLLALALAGCDIEVTKPADVEQSPEMKAASAADQLGEYDKAIAGYRDAIAKYPRSALPHMKLALVLHDVKKDYLGAIYNYRMYLELANQTKDARSFDIVNDRIRKAEQLLAAQYVSLVSKGNPNETIELSNTVNELNKRVNKLAVENNTLTSSNETLRTEIVALNGQITRLKLLLDKIRNTSNGGSGKSVSLAGVVQYQTISNEDGTTSQVTTYEVRSGDTLSRIAEIAYGDSKKWPKIKKANPDKIKDDRVRPGDVLIIPDE